MYVAIDNWVKCTDSQWLRTTIQKEYRFVRKHLGFSGIRQPKVQAENANILREKTNDLLLKDAIQRVPAKDYSASAF